MRAKPSDSKQSGQPQQGRPRNSKDKTKRKQKTFTPKMKASLMVWATDAYSKITDIINGVYLSRLNKANLRQLSTAEADSLETLKFDTLCNVAPFTHIDEGVISKAIIHPAPQHIYKTYANWSADISKSLARQLTLDEKRHIQIQLYTIYSGINYGKD
jgi:hypothetical protein